MATKTRIGQCALCRQNGKELQLSHIVPHLVGRYLMKTSPGAIRRTDMPNKTVQDIEKHYLLCHDCEELFSANETWFANNIFLPYEENKKIAFEYDEKLTKFIVSLSWRSLYMDLMEYVQNPDFPQEMLSIFLDAEQIMRDFLLGKRDNIGTIENHIFFLDRVKQNEDTRKIPSISTILHRTISSYGIYNGGSAFTLSKMMGILVVTFYSMDEREQWTNTKIEVNGGTIAAENQCMRSVIGQEIYRWSKQAEDMCNAMSEAQKQKITDKSKKLGESIKEYPIFQDWTDDYYNK